MGVTSREEAYDRPYRHPHAANAWLAATLTGLDRDDVLVTNRRWVLVSS